MRNLDAVDYFVGGLVLAFGIFITWSIVMVVLCMRADRYCLEHGYPQSQVTYNGEAFCANMDGAVTTKVVKVSP